MNNENKLVIVDELNISEKIYSIRNQKVMLDTDLAEIYGYETKKFNQQVKRNIEKFDDDFMFTLTDDEYENLRSQNVTSSWGGNRYKPYAFTEQGIYMLMTVLKGDLATKQSKALIRTFKAMKDYIVENREMIDDKSILKLTITENENRREIENIKKNMATKDDLKQIMDNFIDPDMYKHFLIMDGKKIEADIAYTKIYKTAKKSIYIVDNYIGLKTIELIRETKDTVNIIIFSDNIKNKTMLTSTILSDFRNSYPTLNLSFQKTNGKYHDRYIVIDYKTDKEAIYHCGASSKDAGAKINTISKIEDKELYKEMVEELLNNPTLIIK